MQSENQINKKKEGYNANYFIRKGSKIVLLPLFTTIIIESPLITELSDIITSEVYNNENN